MASEAPLVACARGGDVTGVRSHLSRASVDVDARDSRGCTALHAAATEGHAAVVTMLLRAGADADAKDAHSRTSVALAAERGHAAVVEALASAGADVTVHDSFSRTPLHWAAQRGDGGMVHALLGGDDGKGGGSAAVLDAQTSSGDTALHWLCAAPPTRARADALAVLLAVGANPSLTNEAGATPLSVLAEHAARGDAAAASAMEVALVSAASRRAAETSELEALKAAETRTGAGASAGAGAMTAAPSGTAISNGAAEAVAVTAKPVAGTGTGTGPGATGVKSAPAFSNMRPKRMGGSTMLGGMGKGIGSIGGGPGKRKMVLKMKPKAKK